MSHYIEIRDCSLTQYNTLRIQSVAHTVVFPLDNYGVKEILETYSEKTIFFLGNGSNVLFSKNYYDETYVFVSFRHMQEISFNDNRVKAQAGVTLSQLSWFALEIGIQGFEFLEDIPGSIGGAIIMNAGTYKDMIGQLVTEVTYYSRETGQILTDTAKDEDFGKRWSIWAERGDIVLEVTFAIEEEKRLTYYEPILDELQANKKRRYLKQPRNYPNAGSVFKRPVKDGKQHYIWQLFEGCNLRGYRVGNAMISDKHPGFIVNVNNADPQDILSIIDLAQKKVKEKYDIDIELEWVIV